MILRRAGTLAFAASIVLASGQASAQTRACPPCGPYDRCIDGVCVPPAEAPPPGVAPVLPAPPAEPLPGPPPPPAEPEPVVPAPAPAARPPAPARAPRSAPKARRPVRHVDGEEDEDQDDTPAWRKGMVMLPFIGLHAVEGIAANDYDAGLRLGGILGTRVAPTVSLNVELAVDLLNANRAAGSTSGQASGHDLTLAFSPLFHGSSSIGELVVGPKLGYWTSGLTAPVQGSSELQFSQAGWAFGVNLGAFAGLNDTVGLGALLSYQMTFLSQSCARGSTVLVPGCTSNDFAPQILSFSIAAIF